MENFKQKQEGIIMIILKFLFYLFFATIYIVIGAIISSIYGFLVGETNFIQFGLDFCWLSPVIVFIIFMVYLSERMASERMASEKKKMKTAFWICIAAFSVPVILNIFSMFFNLINLKGASGLIHDFRFYPILIIPVGAIFIAYLKENIDWEFVRVQLKKILQKLKLKRI